MSTTITIHDTPVPALGFGTYKLRGDDCVEGVRDALAVGYRHIDTAQMYGNEAEVGEGLRRSDVPRDDVFVVSKVAPRSFAREEALATTRRSVEALGVDRVDLMLLHWPPSSEPVSEPLGALRELKDEGLVRHIGVSNFSVEQVEEAAGYAEIFCNQVEYQPFKRPDDLLAHAQEHGYLLTAYSPLAKGRVSSDATLTEIAERLGRTPAQVSLRWLLDRGIAPIPKTGSAERRRENFDLDFTLDEEDVARIDELGG